MATAVHRPGGSRRFLFGAGLAVALFAALVLSLDVRTTATELIGANPWFVALAVCCSLFAQLCWSLTTVALVDGIDGSLPRRRIQLGYLSGTFGKQVLPLGNVGGSAILAYVISEDLNHRFRDVFAAVTASELLVFSGSLGVAVLGLVALLVDPVSGFDGPLVLALLASVVFLLVAGGAVLAYRRRYIATLVASMASLVRLTVGRLSTRVGRLLAPRRVEAGIDSFLSAFGAATGDTRRLVFGATAAVLGWLAFAFALLFGFAAVDVSLAVGLALFLAPASGVATFVPTPGGLGTTEVGLTAFLAFLTGVPPEVAAAGVLVYRVATYWVVVSVGAMASVYLSVTVWHALD
ncbi:flippase-like domain-containing protein [Haloarcula marina]|uniref:flippase-like domain-containing protein n=1 Tax=Haloarcula marina TaxID=2961574 RepID=UPI0020B6B148|nr:flippase-like domain-containing protein [Halomicroarcula marina]